MTINNIFEIKNSRDNQKKYVIKRDRKSIPFHHKSKYKTND